MRARYSVPFLCVLAAVGAVWLLEPTPLRPGVPVGTPPGTLQTLTRAYPQEPAPTAHTPSASSTMSATPALAAQRAPAMVVLSVGSTTYRVPLAAPETAVALMQELASSTTFTYTAESYPSLGLFISSINGTPNANGKYWMLYINGTLSTLGASQAQITPGDLIEWRYE